MDHVKTVCPVLEANVILKQGLYETSISLRGVDQNYLSQIPIQYGRYPEPGELSLLAGNQIKMWFNNSSSFDAFYF